LQETAQLVKDAGQKCVIYCGDIRDEERCKDIVERAYSDFGSVDILVNNAAFQVGAMVCCLCLAVHGVRCVAAAALHSSVDGMT
jgi:NAD(P)-dependent dehydrogenase (short-subunit alcohol dehydrogenase family)